MFSQNTAGVGGVITGRRICWDCKCFFFFYPIHCQRPHTGTLLWILYISTLCHTCQKGSRCFGVDRWDSRSLQMFTELNTAHQDTQECVDVSIGTLGTFWQTLSVSLWSWRLWRHKADLMQVQNWKTPSPVWEKWWWLLLFHQSCLHY